MLEKKKTVETEFRKDAAKIIGELATNEHKKLMALRSTKMVFICGDFVEKPDGTKGPTSAMIKLNEKFKDAKIDSFMLNHVGTPLDHHSKETIALETADMVILINGRGAGTIGETAISMSGVLGMKTLFLHKEGEISEDMLMSETEYTTHFPIKYSYLNDPDMIIKAFNYGKQLINCICRKEMKSESRGDGDG